MRWAKLAGPLSAALVCFVLGTGVTDVDAQTRRPGKAAKGPKKGKRGGKAAETEAGEGKGEDDEAKEGDAKKGDAKEKEKESGEKSGEKGRVLGAETGKAAAPGVQVLEEKQTGDAGVKTYKFGAVEVEGRLKSPQIVYFLRRVRAEFAAGQLGHRSFMGELSDTRRNPSLK
jgi:hypothetical protein